MNERKGEVLAAKNAKIAKGDAFVIAFSTSRLSGALGQN